MPQITLTEEQAQIIREAREPIVLTDTAGTVRIVSEPFDAVVLAEYHHDKMLGIEEEGIPSEKVTEYLRALAAEERRLGSPMSEEQIDVFIRRLESSEVA